MDYYEHDPFGDDELEAKPAPPKPQLPHCRHCPGREVVDDGYGEFVHNDDMMYSCQPGKAVTTFAEPV